MLRWSRFCSPVTRVTALMLAITAPTVHALPFPATWIGGNGNWLALRPGDWAIVDFSSPWKFFPDNDGSDYFFVLIPNGHVHLDDGVVPGELGVPVPFLGVEVSTLALASGGELGIGGSGSLTVNGIEGVGSLITNQGRITLDGAGSLAAPFAMSILGAGEIALGSDDAVITGLGVITHDEAHTLSGFGNVASSVFINDGTVLADVSTRAMRFTGLQLVNGGSLRAAGRVPGEAGGELRLAPLLSFANDGEVIADHGLVKIEQTDIDNGGEIGARLLGTMILEEVTVDNHGRLFVEAGGAFELRGDNFIDGGVLDAAAGAGFTVTNGRTEVSGGITLGGEFATAGGTLRFRGVDLAMHNGTVHLAAGTVADALVGNTFRGGRWSGSGRLNVLAPSTWDGTPSLAIDGTTIALATALHRWHGQFHNDGTIALEENTFNSSLRFVLDGATRFDGSGRVLVAAGDANRFEADGGDAMLVNGTDHTLAVAAGAAATVDVALSNEGLVDIDGGGASLLVQGEVANRGVMSAAGGGTLKFSSPLAAGLVIDNADGRIEALAGGTVLFGDGHPLSSAITLRGGTLAGPGLLRGLNALVFDGLAHGAITLEDGATLVRGGGTTTAFGTFVNDGTLKLEDTTGFLSGNARLAVSGAWHVDGSGEILLADNSETLIDGTDATALMVLGADQRVHTAANTFGSVNVAMENHGEVVGEGANSTLVVRGQITNRGLFAARAGGTLVFEPGAVAGLVIDNLGGRIEAAAGATVQLGGGHPLSPATTVRGGTLGGPGALRGGTGLVLDGATNGAITLEDGATLTRSGGTTTAVGTLVNDGVLKIEDTTGFLSGPSRIMVGGTLHIDGVGEILMSGNTESLVNGSDASAQLVLGTGQRLHTAANTSATLDVATVNHGEVLAHGNNASLFVQRDVTNLGLMAARDGGTLHFNPSLSAGLVIDNAAGRIEAGAGATVQLGGGHPLSPATTLRGGTLGGSGVLRSATALVLDGATRGALTLEAGATLRRAGGTTTAFGTLNNHGTLLLEDTTGFLSGNARLAVAGELRLDGHGSVRFAQGDEMLIDGTAPGARLVLGGGQVLGNQANASGTVNLLLENHGRVQGEGANGRVLIQSNVVNRGVLAAQGGGLLSFEGATSAGVVIDNHGGRLETAAGSIIALGNGHPAAPFVHLHGGVIAGNGRVELVKATLSEGVTIAPGSSAGLLTFGGNLDFDPLGLLEIELGGANAGVDFDRVAVTGNARLDGRLELDLVGGFAPGDGDVFRILSAASVSGIFDNIVNGLVHFEGGSFEVVIGAGFVDLRHFTPAPVPLPAPGALLGVALAALALHGRRARR
ncbi:MAG: hypothetical protein IPM80_16520 [Proteobacteria bacterium]|nr:hypothetical protein [Pseudomonadota bacterium]